MVREQQEVYGGSVGGAERLSEVQEVEFLAYLINRAGARTGNTRRSKPAMEIAR